MNITSVSASNPKRRYPLIEPLYAAWGELGVKPMAYGCTGRNEGLSEWLENWVDGQRQSAQHAYPLDGNRILTGAQVTKISLQRALPRPRIGCPR